MSAVVVMVTVSNRVKYLNAFLETLVAHAPHYPVHIHLQDPEHRADEIVFPKGLQVAGFEVTPEPVGCHAARVMALRQLDGQGFDGYINVDDDVLLTPHTNWDPAVGYAAQPGVGFVLTAWSRAASIYLKRIEGGLSHEVGQRILVYNGGGQAYREEVAEMMRALDPCPARYDDIWPLTTYVNGRMNYVYYGSQSIHHTVSKGGMKKYMADEPRPLLGWRYVNYPLFAGGRVGAEYGIGLDKDLKQIAHTEHLEARLKHPDWVLNRAGTRAGTPPLAPLPSKESVRG